MIKENETYTGKEVKEMFYKAFDKAIERNREERKKSLKINKIKDKKSQTMFELNDDLSFLKDVTLIMRELFE